MNLKLPPRDELIETLQSVLQETDLRRPLDSIEVVVISAYMVRWGLEYPPGVPPPDTIEGWVEWAVNCLKTS